MPESRRTSTLGAASVLVALAAVHCERLPEAARRPPGEGPAVSRDATDGAASGDAGKTETSAAAARCAAEDRGRVSGLIHDRPIDERWHPSGAGLVAEAPWRIVDMLSGGGWELLRGTEPGDPRAPFGERGFDVGIVRTPLESALSGAVVCLEGGTAERASPTDVLSVRAARARVLGRCPGGSPVAGEVLLCDHDHEACGRPGQGTLDGRIVDGTELHLSGDSTAPPSFGVLGLGDHLLLVAAAETAPAAGETVPLAGVLVVLPRATLPTRQGAVFCLGEGSAVHWLTAGGTRVVVKNATKLGDCGDPSDERGAGGPTLDGAPRSPSLLLCR